jgi:hypothetical protein
MKEYPEPLVPADTNTQQMPGFILDVDKLLLSNLWILSTGEAFKAAVGLWCRAWKEIPAGSLPDDDQLLSAYSGAGSNWPAIRDMALRGFIKCSDSRLYHKTLCEDAARASRKQQEYKDRTRAATQARQSRRNDQRDVPRNDERDDDPNALRNENGNVHPITITNTISPKGDISSDKRKSEDPDSDPAFMRFYKSYPRRESKKSAYKAWKSAIRSVDPETIIAAASRYAIARNNEDPQFTPLPASWINAGKWDDEPTERPNNARPQQQQRARPMDGWLQAIADLAPPDDHGGDREASYPLLPSGD